MRVSSKIFYDLNESIFITEYAGVFFYFSSSVYRDKFELRLNDYIKLEKKKLQIKYKFPQNLYSNELNILFAISLYRKIETRGERIEFERSE